MIFIKYKIIKIINLTIIYLFHALKYLNNYNYIIIEYKYCDFSCKNYYGP